MSTEMTPEKVAEIRRQAAENWGMAAYGTLPQWGRDIVALCDEVTRLTEELARHKFETAEISINDYRKAIGITDPAPKTIDWKRFDEMTQVTLEGSTRRMHELSHKLRREADERMQEEGEKSEQ